MSNNYKTANIFPDPHAFAERTSRSPESQSRARRIHAGTIRKIEVAGASTRWWCGCRQTPCILFHKRNKHRWTLLVLRSRFTVSLQCSPRGNSQFILLLFSINYRVDTLCVASLQGLSSTHDRDK